MEKESKNHPIFFARLHYERLKNERRRLDLRYEIHRNHNLALPVLGFTRHNQHTKRRLLAHFGHFRAAEWCEARWQVTWRHGRICVPHPACPEAFELCAWVTYDHACRITGRSAETFARWRWDAGTVPDEAVWRLLEWSLHGCCAWPPRPPRPHSRAGDPAPDAVDQA